MIDITIIKLWGLEIAQIIYPWLRVLSDWMSFTDTKLVSLLRKDLQETLDLLTGGNVGIEKYWQYVGKMILSRQVLGKMGHKVYIKVFVEEEGVWIDFILLVIYGNYQIVLNVLINGINNLRVILIEDLNDW